MDGSSSQEWSSSKFTSEISSFPDNIMLYYYPSLHVTSSISNISNLNAMRHVVKGI